jgi:hypothetical protein
MDKSSPKILAAFEIFKNLPKENKRPIVEKFAQSGHPAKGVNVC